MSRFLSSPFIIRVPFFLILGFNKGTLKQKGQKSTTQEPSCELPGGGFNVSASRHPGPASDDLSVRHMLAYCRSAFYTIEVQGTPERWNMGLGGFVLGSPILYLKGMRILGFYYTGGGQLQLFGGCRRT